MTLVTRKLWIRQKLKVILYAFLSSADFFSNHFFKKFFFCFSLFCSLHPKSTAMVMEGRSVHLTTLFPGQA